MDKIKFNNGKFTILQISDAQDLHWVRKTMLRMLNKAADIVKPDLIIYTGDNVLGNHICDKRFGKGQKKLTKEQEYKRLKKALYHILNIAMKRNISFAAIFGNHDDRNSFTKDEQADIFREISLNRGFINKGDLCGTDCLPVYSSDGKKRIMNLWMIDTAYYDHENNKCFEEIKKSHVEWFKAESEKLKAENGGKAYPSLMFVHIPINNDFCIECSKDEATCENKGKYYKLHNANGILCEPIFPTEDSYGFYNAILDDGGILGIISGHNHLNCYEGEKDSIRFIATPGASFRCYGNKLRGVRVLTIDEDSPENFISTALDYSSICGNGLFAKFGWLWDADEMEKTKYTLLCIIILLVLLSAAAIILLKLL